MKNFLIWLVCMLCSPLFSQTLQLHYDPRYTLDPEHNSRNFTTLYFEYFKNQDSGKLFIKPGSFLLKMQADFLGQAENIGKFYMQVSQSFRFWQPKIFLNLQYSGGLGVAEPKQYSYYITNAYSLGLSFPFKWGDVYLASVLNLKFLPYKDPSMDPLLTLYWWKGLWNYKAEFSGDFSAWTENKNHGDANTAGASGKRFYFFAEPQFWYNITNHFSIGTKGNLYFHVLNFNNLLQIYPTLAVRFKL